MKKLPNFRNSDILHFIAIGGIGMSALAKILLEAGVSVSGSDLEENNLTDYLQSKGATIHKGHSAENIKKATAVVKSTAIRSTNPELTAAVEKNIPVIHRAELLNKIMQGYKTAIGVTGTHGKTTTTGMITTIFHELDLDPGFAIGGEIPKLKTNAAFGGGERFIAELDESDRTIELYSPDISVITNLEYEHPEHYKGGYKQLIEVFTKFSKGLKPESKVIINIDDAGNRDLLGAAECAFSASTVITYSTLSKDADYYTNSENKFYKKGEYLGEIKLNVPGLHNVSNATAAIAAAMEAGLDFTQASEALSKFTGMKKRFQTLGHVHGARIVDDYAHHPTEIRATLKTARSVTNGRVIGVFQPHRYTRLASLWDDFLLCFDEADILYVCNVFAASEDPIENINSGEFYKNLQHPCAYYINGELDSVAEAVIKEIKPEDIVVTMGAGTITKLGRIIIDKVNGKTLKCL